jgi:23S rRNA pseudouridine1911/1915/1917 synthase
MVETSTNGTGSSGEEDRVRAFTVEEADAGNRLDVLIAARVPGVSRSAAQRLVDGGHVRVDGRKRPQGFRLNEGSRVEVVLPVEEERPAPATPSVGDLDILFEDDEVLVLNKRAGLVVHPGAGHRSGTLADMLAASGRMLAVVAGEDRAGLVHRLDRDTSGVIVIAKTDRSHEALSVQFKERTIRKAYLAIVLGPHIADRGMWQSQFGRRAGDRKLFTGRVREGREAVTEFETILRGTLSALVLARPRTGRTHQIRVHLAENGHPIVGDHMYGRAYPRPDSLPKTEVAALKAITRQALHAWALRFLHPTTRQPMELFAPLPRDMREACEVVFGADWQEALPAHPFAVEATPVPVRRPRPPRPPRPL